MTDLWDCRIMGKGRKHPEAAVRMNFLHQAATCVLKSTGNKVLIDCLAVLLNQRLLAGRLVALNDQISGFECSTWQSHGCCWSEKSSSGLQGDQENHMQGFLSFQKERKNLFCQKKGKLSMIFLGMSPSSSTRPLF